MKRARLLSWILYTSLFDVTRADGTFFVPRAVHNRIVRLDGESPWWER